MRKNDLLFLISVLSYSILFYQQGGGVNFFLFNILLIVILLIKNPALLKNIPFAGFAALSLLSSAGILLYGNLFSVIINFFCLSIAAGFAANENISILLAGVQTAFSYCATPLSAGMDFLQRKQERKNHRAVVPRIFFSILVIFIFFLFLFLYRQSNPLFRIFTDKINLDFISIGWIFFTLGGAWLMYGFFFPKFLSWFSLIDSQFKNKIQHDTDNIKEEKIMQMIPERNSGILLLSLLNLLLFSVHIIDFYFLYITQSLPEEITYSQFVHQGIYTLIFSVVLAVGIIIFYFRGHHNFYDKNGMLKTLALLWVIQNAVLIISGAVKNGLYIHEYSLTYKRIGVFVFLILTFSGLIFTWVKILRRKTVWYLIRSNIWSCFTVLGIMTLINWDVVITRYNLIYSKVPDKEYLLSLSSSVIPELLPLKTEILTRKTSLEPDEMNFIARLIEKEKNFIDKKKKKEWQSWNIDDQKVYDFIKKYEVQP